MSIERRIVRLEERRQQAHTAPAAHMVYHGDMAEAVIEATGERLPYEEFARRYPGTAPSRPTSPTRMACA